MLGKKKKAEEFQEMVRREVLGAMVDLESALWEKMAEIEKKLDMKYEQAFVAIAQKLEDERTQDKDVLEQTMAEWCAEETGKADEHRATGVRLQEHNYKHMTTVEDYVALQKEVLSEIRDCVKVLALDKMKGGKRVLNDSN